MQLVNVVRVLVVLCDVCSCFIIPFLFGSVSFFLFFFLKFQFINEINWMNCVGTISLFDVSSVFLFSFVFFPFFSSRWIYSTALSSTSTSTSTLAIHHDKQHISEEHEVIARGDDEEKGSRNKTETRWFLYLLYNSQRDGSKRGSGAHKSSTVGATMSSSATSPPQNCQSASFSSASSSSSLKGNVSV